MNMQDLNSENMALVFKSMNLQSDIKQLLQKSLRLDGEVAMDAACEVIHLMMQSGTVRPELQAIYEAADNVDDDDLPAGLQDLINLT